LFFKDFATLRDHLRIAMVEYKQNHEMGDADYAAVLRKHGGK
jgi:hypothetical protein